MAVRRIAWLLAILAVAIQWPLWFGKGGWLRVWDLQRQVEAQRGENLKLTERNAALAAELDSLRAGREAIEERARSQLNMVRPDEVFVQYVPRGAAPRAASGAVPHADAKAEEGAGAPPAATAGTAAAPAGPPASAKKPAR